MEIEHISQEPSMKKGKRIEASYQIRPKVHRERPHRPINHNNGPRRDQTPNSLHNLRDLEHLHGLMGLVLNLGIIKQLGHSPLQRSNLSFNHGPQNHDAIYVGRHLAFEDL